MASSSESPCRLAVYLAVRAPIAVILRKGPSAWTRLSIWHRDTDEFEHGQWFRGRVYERRCDLSPDGSLFAYFALKPPGPGNEIGMDSWAAVSRPPWFTALALWGMGSTYSAGGFFVSGRELFLGGITGGPDRGALPNWLHLTSNAPYTDGTPEWTSRTIYFNRLLRDGWKPEPGTDHPNPSWERFSKDGSRKLVMAPNLKAGTETYGGRFRTEYALEHQGGLQPLGAATWADWVGPDRLVMAKDGRLVDVAAGGTPTELEDFNPQVPDPQKSPGSALEWPIAPDWPRAPSS